MIALLLRDFKSKCTKEITTFKTSPIEETIEALSTSEEEENRVTDVLNLFERNISTSCVADNSQLLLADFNESLKEDSQITMLPNYTINSTGNEQGNYLVIDLGGSTLRVAVITIDAPNDDEDRSKRVHIILERKWEISNNFKVIDYNFFKWIGERIFETLQHQHVISPTQIIDTGITWSFPLETTAHNNGKINFVSKGYTIAPEIYNRDLKAVIESCLLKEYKVNINVQVIVNDSLAVYAAGTFLDRYTKLAMVLGTGLNMCCSLKPDQLHDNKKIGGESSILFNAELSLFGRSFVTFNANKYDEIIDSRFKYTHNDLPFKPHLSTDPDLKTLFQPLELMTGGRYLPEITRLIMVELIESKDLLTHAGIDHSELYLIYKGFNGELMCFILEDNSIQSIKQKLADTYQWNMSHITDEDVINLKTLINGVLTRAAFVVATSIVSFIRLLKEHNDDLCNESLFRIGFVGSVLLYFHSYREAILDYVNGCQYIKDMQLKVEFKHVDNSSIVGAAIGAAYYKNS